MGLTFGNQEDDDCTHTSFGPKIDKNGGLEELNRVVVIELQARP